MSRTIVLNALLATTMLVGSMPTALAQPQGHGSAMQGMAMSRQTLLVAQLDKAQVVGGSSSPATATGAFLLDGAQHALTYSLTYEGLNAAPKRIALYNFGKGRNGEAIGTLCGEGAQVCPGSASGTLSGTFGRGDGRALDSRLVGEFDSGRIYAEIVGGDGKPAIRGQLGTNTAMVAVANYVAHLAPIAGSGSTGDGTAVVSETFLPGAKVAVFYAATIAGASGPPTNAALVADKAAAHAFATRLALPQVKLLGGNEGGGGSISGAYDVDSAQPRALFATRLSSTPGAAAGIVLTTSRHPKGELYGVLVRVR